MVAHQNFQQADAASVVGKTMTNSAGDGTAQPAARVAPVVPARCA